MKNIYNIFLPWRSVAKIAEILNTTLRTNIKDIFDETAEMINVLLHIHSSPQQKILMQEKMLNILDQ